MIRRIRTCTIALAAAAICFDAQNVTAAPHHISTKPPAATIAGLRDVADDLGVSPQFLFAMIRLGETDGVKAQDVVEGIRSLGKTLNDAQFGRNFEANGLLSQFQVPPIATLADGSIDIAPSLLALARALGKIKNPYTQETLLERLDGLQLLPLLRRGEQPMLDSVTSTRAEFDSLTD